MTGFKRTLPLLILAALLAGCALLRVPQPEPPAETPPPAETMPAPTEPAPPEEIHYRLTAVGDLMCHKLQYEAAYGKDGYDFAPTFAHIASAFADSDLVVGNLETTFAGPEKTYSEYPTFNTPDSFARALKDMGLDVALTANNHSLDRRFYGLSRTLDVLDAAGLAHTGTFRSPEEDRILLVDRDGLRIAFLAYSYGTNGIAFDKGRAYSLNLIDEALIRSDIAAARDLSPDLIVVGLHFGQEYQQQPNEKQQALAAACFDEGADIVLGTHPHVVQQQRLEEVTDRFGVTKRRFVAYSLGNFISAQRTAPRDAGVITHLDLVKSGDRTEIRQVTTLPTWVDQSTGAGRSMFRVLPVREALDQPDAFGLLTEKDLFKLNRSWEYVTHALDAP